MFLDEADGASYRFAFVSHKFDAFSNDASTLSSGRIQDRAHLAPFTEGKKAGRAIWEADAMPMPPSETGRIA